MATQTFLVLIGSDSRYQHLEGHLSDSSFLSLFPCDQTPTVVLQILNAEEQPPHLILFVMNSPASLDQGSFALREFRANLRTAHVPIVILLADDLADLAIALYRAGVNTVIPESRLLDVQGKVDTATFTGLCAYWTELACLTNPS